METACCLSTRISLWRRFILGQFMRRRGLVGWRGCPLRGLRCPHARGAVPRRQARDPGGCPASGPRNAVAQRPPEISADAPAALQARPLRSVDVALPPDLPECDVV